MKDESKLVFFSKKSQIFTTKVQKLFTSYRELIGIVFSLSIYEYISIGSIISLMF